MKDKRKILACLIFCSITQLVTAQSDAVFDWVNTVSSDVWDQARSVATDFEGNMVSVGYFGGWSGGNAEFDMGSTSIDLTSNGESDLYIYKIDSNDNLLWFKQIGGSSSDQALFVTTDMTGNVYVSGLFGATTDFDPGPDVVNLSATSADAFILKLDNSGNFIWVRQMEGIALQHVWSMAIDINGDILACGDFEYTTDFDMGSGVTELTAQDIDAFMLKLDSSGNFLWVRQLEGIDNEVALSITTDLDGNVYTTGNAASGEYIFVQKLAGNGDLVWTKQIGPLTIGRGNSIVSDATGSIYITGQFYGSADFDSGPGNADLSAPNSADIFILKLNEAGNLIWVKQLAGTVYNQSGMSLATNNVGDLYVAGWFQSILDFDPGSGTSIRGTDVDSDLFVLKLTGSGTFVWAKNVESSFGSAAFSMALGRNSSIYLVGAHRGTTDFDPGSGVVNRTSNGLSGGDDAFTLKLRDCEITHKTDTVVACNSYTWTNGITYSSSGTYTYSLINLAGCDSIRTLNLTIGTLNPTVTQIDDLTLSSNTSNGVYQWLDCSNGYSEITGQSEQSFIATANGSFAVEVSVIGCTTDTSECITVDNVGFESQDLSGRIKLAPNPTEGRINISSDQPLEHCSFQIFAPEGTLVREFDLTNLVSDTLTIEGPAGLYLIKVITKTTTTTYRICKVK